MCVFIVFMLVIVTKNTPDILLEYLSYTDDIRDYQQNTPDYILLEYLRYTDSIRGYQQNTPDILL